MLLNIFRRKKTLEKLYEKYENLRIEAFKIAQSNSAKSEELLKEAKMVSDEIDRLKSEMEINKIN